MSKIKFFQISFLVLLINLQFTAESAAIENGEHGKVLLVLLDGMRWDLFGLNLPGLKEVEEQGVRAEWMDGIFITMTIPSTFSIATGKTYKLPY